MSSIGRIALEELVTEALNKAFRHGGEIRLVKSGKGDFLVPDEKEASAAVVDRCLDSGAPTCH